MIGESFHKEISKFVNDFKNIHFFFLPFITLLNEYCLLFGTATNKIRRKKKGQAVFTCHARSTLEAAGAEIINEIRSCDLSKWTGNKSLLIGPSQGWRQGGGLWFPSREDRASWKLQVSRETLPVPAQEDCQIKTQ